MESAGIKARCLASTRVVKEVDSNEGQDERGEDILDGAKRKEGNSDQASDASSDEEEVSETERSDTSRSISTSDTSTDSDESHSSNTSSYVNRAQYTPCIQESQLSPDGTCIFTSDYARTFSVYPVPAPALTSTLPRPLQPYATFSSQNPIWAFAVNPFFDVNDSNSTNVLVSRRDSYISLHNALWDITREYNDDENDGNKATTSSSPVDISKPLASYKLIDNLTEAVTTPTSLLYSEDGTHFFAGQQNSIAVFDLEYTDNPIQNIRTIPSKRSKLKGGGRGFKGVISALAISPPILSSTPTPYSSGSRILAAGSRTRHIGLFSSTTGEELTSFSLPGTLDGRKIHNQNLRHVIGDGVSQLKFSPCGKYLYVAERDSDALLLYDVRMFGLGVAYCVGRNARTRQRLGFDIWSAAASSEYELESSPHEVWAGGVDGHVRVWRDPQNKEGAVSPDETIRINEDNTPVVSTLVHQSGQLLVAACGKVEVFDHEEEEREQERHSAKRRGGGIRPRYREWGSLEILGLE